MITYSETSVTMIHLCSVYTAPRLTNCGINENLELKSNNLTRPDLTVAQRRWKLKKRR